MIALSNGHKFEYACASGALGYIGDSKYLGYWWEKPLHFLGVIDPKNLLLITKTFTLSPRVGNLKMWCPWRCVRLLPNDNVVNSVGLTNPGLDWWVNNCYRNCIKRGYKVVVSISPESISDARIMSGALDSLCPKIVGIEVNVSCPNTENKLDDVDRACRLVRAVSCYTSHPVFVKLGWQMPYFDICEELDDGSVEVFDLINTVPFSIVYPGQISPLAKYNLEGGVSGPAIRKYAREALETVKRKGIRTPILSGGGIDADEIETRRGTADAFAFGTLFLKHPAAAKDIMCSTK